MHGVWSAITYVFNVFPVFFLRLSLFNFDTTLSSLDFTERDLHRLPLNGGFQGIPPYAEAACWFSHTSTFAALSFALGGESVTLPLKQEAETRLLCIFPSGLLLHQCQASALSMLIDAATAALTFGLAFTVETSHFVVLNPIIDSNHW